MLYEMMPRCFRGWCWDTLGDDARTPRADAGMFQGTHWYAFRNDAEML